MKLLENAALGAMRAVADLRAADLDGEESAVNIMLSLLSPQEREVVRYRYGLGRDQLPTLREIGAAMGLSGQRVSQIEQKARRRLAWFVRVVGPVGSAALEAYAIARQEHRDEVERLALIQVQNADAARTRRRVEKDARDEARRAKARMKAWERKLDEAEARRANLWRALNMVIGRIEGMERRGWLARHLLPYSSVLSRLCAELADLQAKLRETDAEVSGILAVPASPREE